MGKVGTESPTFIQPVAERKDGIQAMFARQATSSQQLKGAKRKRSTSPKPSDTTMQAQKESSQGKMKPSVDKLNTWEDDSEIEYVDGPSSGDKVKCRVRLYVGRPCAERTITRSRRQKTSKIRVAHLHYPPRQQR